VQVWSIASGSSGNAYLVEASGTRVLIECGVSAATAERALLALGTTPASLSAVFLTHDHSDHIRGARELSDRYSVPIFATEGTLGHPSLRGSPFGRPVRDGSSLRVGELEVRAFAVPHDGVEPVGFRLEGQHGSAAIVTDLGHMPDSAMPFLLDLDLLVLEANHDLEMLWQGPYRPHLKRRIAGQLGHLSNVATGEVVARCGDRAPRALWLAHLSKVNNDPLRAAEQVSGVLRSRGLRHLKPVVLPRARPGQHWSAIPAPKQLSLF
jgi:phosphoribosyl 1,2-cyclic phosphodiesterase